MPVDVERQLAALGEIWNETIAHVELSEITSPGASRNGGVAEDDGEGEVPVVELPATARRPMRRVLLGAAAAVVLVAALGIVVLRMEGPDEPGEQIIEPPSTATPSTVAPPSTATPTTVAAPSPPSAPFEGTWQGGQDDGEGTGVQTMEIVHSGGDEYQVVVRNDVAAACAGGPSTVTGTGRVDGSVRLVIAQPTLTCDDGTAPVGLPQAARANFTLIYEQAFDTLLSGVTSSDGGGIFEGEWSRVGGGATSGGLWPQESLEGVPEAQRLADAGESDWVWQVEPGLHRGDGLAESQILVHFIRDRLHWEQYRCCVYSGEFPADDGGYADVWVVRCASGVTDTLGRDEFSGCAPTLDDGRHEWVRVSFAQPDRRGDDGLWVVTEWEISEPVEVAAAPADAETTAVLEGFLAARVTGSGAEDYLRTAAADFEIPQLYATSTGADFERFEFERTSAPAWPTGETRFSVRLFADGGQTVVEQSFRMTRDATGRLGLDLVARSNDPAATGPDPTATGAPASGWLAFTLGDVRSDIYLVREGLAPRRVDLAESDATYKNCPAFSPDSGRLMFGRATGNWQDGYEHVELVVVTVGDDGSVSPLTTIPLEGMHGVPCAIWAPDGRWAAFGGGDAADYRNGGTDGVWLVDTVSGEIRQLPGYHPHDLEWRPGTDELAITGDRPDNEIGDARIDVYTVSTGDIRTLGDVEAAYLTWSPDGTTLAFTHSTDGDSSADASIWLVDADGTDLRLLAEEAVDSLHGIGPVWSPRGDLIAYQRRIGCCESSEVVLVAATGDDPTKPLGTKTVIAPPQTTAWDEIYPRVVTWTPDGTHLVYLGWGGDFDESALVVVPIAAGQSPIVLGDGIDAGFGTPWLPIQTMTGTGPLA
jgi:hypothetical protein